MALDVRLSNDGEAHQRCSSESVNRCVSCSSHRSRVEAKGDWLCAEKGRRLISRPDGRHHQIRSKRRLEDGELTVSVFATMFGNEWVRSYQGDMSTPTASAGKPKLQMTWRCASDM